MPNVLPLARFPVVNTRDPELAVALYASFPTRVVLEPPARRTQFAWRANSTSFGALTISAYAMSGPVCIQTEAVDDTYSFSFPTGRARGDGWVGKDGVQLAGGQQGIVVSAGLPTRGRLEDGYEGLQVGIAARELTDAFVVLSGSTVRTPLRFHSQFISGQPQGGAFLRLLRFIVHELDCEDPASSALVVARHVEALLFLLLTEQPHNHSNCIHQAARAAEPKHVRLAAEYIDAHLQQPLCMAQLTNLTGVSVRSLQTGFLQHRGVSPMAFLRLRRLLLARKLLLTGKTTVTEVALACGFEHLGRFSTQYRARYGERPSDTLLQRRLRTKTLIRQPR